MKLRVIVTALSFTILSGCAILRELLLASQQTGAGFNQPNFTFRNVALTDISLGGLNLDTVWDLNNPNPIGLSLATVDYALFIENKQVVAGAPQNGLQIAANGATQLHFPAGIKFADIAQVVETFLSRDNASWRAEGSLGVQTPISVIICAMQTRTISTAGRSGVTKSVSSRERRRRSSTERSIGPASCFR